MISLSRFAESPERMAQWMALVAVILFGGSFLLSCYNPSADHPFAWTFLLSLAISGLASSYGCLLSLFLMLKHGRVSASLGLNLLNFSFCSSLCLLQLIYMRFPLPSLFVFCCFATLLLGLMLVLNKQLNSILALSVPERTSLTLVTLTLLLGLSSWELRSLEFKGLEVPLLSLARDFYLTLACHPLLVTLLRWLKSKGSRELREVGAPSNFSLDFKRSPILSKTYLSHCLLCLGSATVWQWILIKFPSDSPFEPWLGSRLVWAAVSISWLPALYQLLVQWQQVKILASRMSKRVRPAQKKIDPLFLQHSRSGLSETSWLGLRTAILTIDHDPHEECRSQLPSWLYRARQLQCEQVVSQIFKNRILSCQMQGSQLLLTIDPEHSSASCLDALLILTVLYLDGLSLVEKRLKQLVRLLPILDPDLAQQISESKLETLFSRLQGLFHIDFNWIDQSVQSKNGVDSSHLQLELLNLNERHRVLNQLSSSQKIGNFVWISEAAQDRLKSQSPYLATIVERCPIQMEKIPGKKTESAVFLIKFENLIPRLQRYHGLDELRSNLATLPLTLESQQEINKIYSIAQSSPDLDSIKATFKKIALYDWKGFRAKDLALDLVLKLVETIDESRRGDRVTPQEALALRLEARDLARLIGYPCQELHNSHLYKLELRQLEELQRICLDANHPRWREAWLLLASMPINHLPIETIARLLRMVASTCQSSQLHRNKSLLPKVVEAFFQIARILPPNFDSELLAVFNQLARTLIESNAEPHLLLQFMDGKTAFDQHRGCDFILDLALLKVWQKTVEPLIHSKAVPKDTALALELRWKTFASSLYQVKSVSA